jgi:hypothetical protein
MTFNVSDPQITSRDDGTTELSASLAGERLWFRVPAAWPVEMRGDAFAIAALLPAMSRGEQLVIDPSLPVSRTLLTGMAEVQQIFRLWGPAFRQRFTPVAIDATVDDPMPQLPDVTASFFSGGVDGTHTFLNAPVPVTHAVFSGGIDFQLGNPVWEEAAARNRRWLADRGVPLVEVSSNIRFVGHAFGLGWNTHNGAGLSAIGHVLGAGRVLIAAGRTWRELFPDGTHPLTDPLWSSNRTEILHIGRGHKRWEKIAAIAQAPGAIDLLRVCWQDKGYNCGRCEKCIRTMVLLRLLKLASPSFPPLDDLALVGRRPHDAGDAVFVREALDLAIDRGDAELIHWLSTSLRRYRVRTLAGNAKRLLLDAIR